VSRRVRLAEAARSKVFFFFVGAHVGSGVVHVIRGQAHEPVFADPQPWYVQLLVQRLACGIVRKMWG